MVWATIGCAPSRRPSSGTVTSRDGSGCRRVSQSWRRRGGGSPAGRRCWALRTCAHDRTLRARATIARANIAPPPLPSQGYPLDWRAVACGGRHCMGVTSTLQLYTWGSDEHGQLGHGIKARHAAPRVPLTRPPGPFLVPRGLSYALPRIYHGTYTPLRDRTEPRRRTRRRRDARGAPHRLRTLASPTTAPLPTPNPRRAR